MISPLMDIPSPSGTGGVKMAARPYKSLPAIFTAITRKPKKQPILRTLTCFSVKSFHLFGLYNPIDKAKSKSASNE
jgi:hypothetical protein